MLYACCYAVLLDSLHIRNHHLTCKIWIFTHIFEVTAVKRSTAYVDSGTEKDVLLAVACFLTDASSVKERHFLVPCSSEVYQSRESRAGVVCPACLIPVIPKHLRTDSVRAIRVPYFRNSKTRNST